MMRNCFQSWKIWSEKADVVSGNFVKMRRLWKQFGWILLKMYLFWWKIMRNWWKRCLKTSRKADVCIGILGKTGTFWNTFDGLLYKIDFMQHFSNTFRKSGWEFVGQESGFEPGFREFAKSEQEKIAQQWKMLEMSSRRRGFSGSVWIFARIFYI